MQENLSASPLPEIITLMYHRISNTDTDPWGICVSTAHFEEHIKYLTTNYNLVSSEDVYNQVSTGKIKAKSICITFDDGYADNYTNAKPILEKYNCAATFFIPTAYINKATLFWWDSLELILMHSKKLPRYLSLQTGGQMYEFEFAMTKLTKQQWQQHINWRWYEDPPTDRCKMFLKLWTILRPLYYEDIKKQMAVLSKWAGSNEEFKNNRLPLTRGNLRKIAAHNLFTIGMHTHTHTFLAGKEKKFQIDEILKCKKMLSNTYGIESKTLSYPYGSYDHYTFEAVKEAKIDACFTTEAISINANSDTLRLGRYQVGNWNISTFKKTT